jgi:hypothetical protein
MGNTLAPGQNGRVDPRLRAAVDASLGWYVDVFALHAIPARTRRGLWSALADPPPWHSAAKTLEPGVEAAHVVLATGGFERCSVADSFGDLALDRHGFELLFEAAWFHRPPTDGPSGPLPQGWSVVSTAPDLAAWNEAHDYTGVLVPGVLDNPRFRILARHRDGALVGGAVTHRGTDVVDLSNVWGGDDDPTMYDEVLAALQALHPGRAVTGYADGPELDEMLARGFTGIGPQRVWIR